jgi:hypothetical protein
MLHPHVDVLEALAVVVAHGREVGEGGAEAIVGHSADDAATRVVEEDVHGRIGEVAEVPEPTLPEEERWLRYVRVRYSLDDW